MRVFAARYSYGYRGVIVKQLIGFRRCGNTIFAGRFVHCNNILHFPLSGFFEDYENSLILWSIVWRDRRRWHHFQPTAGTLAYAGIVTLRVWTEKPIRLYLTGNRHSQWLTWLWCWLNIYGWLAVVWGRIIVR